MTPEWQSWYFKELQASLATCRSEIKLTSGYDRMKMLLAHERFLLWKMERIIMGEQPPANLEERRTAWAKIQSDE